MEFSMALNMNSVGIPGGLRGNARFFRKILGLGLFLAIWGLKKLLRK